MFTDEDLLPLSGLQHFLFCERQCALIHIEQLWVENNFTAEGRAMHAKAHSGVHESRKTKTTVYGTSIRSLELGLIGQTDALEYSADGTILDRSDEVQICAQGMCLEEMKSTSIPLGALFYGKERRREIIEFSNELRNLVLETARRFHALVKSGETPPARYDSKKCPRCSFLEACMPKIGKGKSVQRYLEKAIAMEVDHEAPS